MANMIEQSLLCKVLDAPDLEILHSNGVIEEMFLTCKDEIHFIIEHYNSYKQMPDKLTFLGKFKDFQMLEVTESTDYLVYKLKEAYTYTKLVPLIEDTAKVVKEDSIKAIQYLKEEIEKLEKSVPVSRNKDGYDIISNAGDRLTEYKKRCEVKGLIGIPTGIPKLDEITNGWLWGEDLVVLTGRTNVGKTWIGEYFATMAWNMGYKILMYSGEMSTAMVGFRFDTLNKHFSNMGLLNGSGTLGKKPDTDGAKYLQEDYEKYITQLQQKSGFIVVTPDDFEGRKPNVDEIKSLAIKHGADMIVIDQLSLMSDRDIEMPLIDVCMDMELRGVEIREDYAKELSVKFNAEMAEKEKLCDEYVAKFDKFIEENPTLMRLTKGTKKINYNSPQQVACLFYDIFKLKSVSRKEPRGTGDKIVQQHRNKAKKAGTKKGEEFIQFLDNYQRYKECGKLLGTYIDKIPEVKCAKTNAVHTTYNQYGAKTGRFSSSDTVTKINLQNIPSHEKSIRKIFRARDGYKFVGGDFSQIEPRVLSYVSGDEAMQEAYREGKDLYAIMGSKVYGVPYEDCREFYPDGTVNAEGKHRRTTMKSVLLGIMYERGAKAIGEQFDKSAEWAQKLIDDFYKSFPKIQQLRLKVEKMAEEYGYVTTIQGRKRRLPEMQLPDHDDYRYQEAHRQSLNAVIQGSSADIMKLAMIAIYNDPQYKALDCHMVITVHDELIMEVPEDHIKEGADLLVNTMKRVGHSLIDLPMSVDAEVNDYWYGENLADDYLEEE